MSGFVVNMLVTVFVGNVGPVAGIEMVVEPAVAAEVVVVAWVGPVVGKC